MTVDRTDKKNLTVVEGIKPSEHEWTEMWWKPRGRRGKGTELANREDSRHTYQLTIGRYSLVILGNPGFSYDTEISLGHPYVYVCMWKWRPIDNTRYAGTNNDGSPYGMCM